jgi:hypothetical protein
LRHLVFGLAVGAIIVIISYFLRVAEEIFQALVVFNVFFVCMLFPLNGSLERKLAVLALGDIICLIWNTMFSMLVGSLAVYVWVGFNALFIMLSPFLNSLWVVSLWSISLTFLANSGKGKATVAESDY